MMKFIRMLLNVPRRLSEIEERLGRIEKFTSLEAIERQKDSELLKSISSRPYIVVQGPQQQQTECLGGCEFPSHYYSPDGRYACMKCGRVIQSQIATWVTTSS